MDPNSIGKFDLHRCASVTSVKLKQSVGLLAKSGIVVHNKCKMIWLPPWHQLLPITCGSAHAYVTFLPITNPLMHQEVNMNTAEMTIRVMLDQWNSRNGVTFGTKKTQYEFKRRAKTSHGHRATNRNVIRGALPV